MAIVVVFELGLLKTAIVRGGGGGQAVPIDEDVSQRSGHDV